MTKIEFQQMLVDLMKQGLHIEMFMRGDAVWFDMNTRMKSALHITYNEEKQVVEYEGRYGVKGLIYNMYDLEIVVRSCDHGRGYCGGAWLKILGGVL